MKLFHSCWSFAFAALVIAPAARLHAQADRGPTTRPLLEQLNQEIRSVYHESQAGCVRVQLPSPRWMNDYALAPINKWSKIDPEVRQKLEQAQQQAYAQGRGYGNSANNVNADNNNATRPSQEQQSGKENQSQSPNQQSTIIIVRPPLENNAAQQAQQLQRDNVIGGRLQMDVKAGAEFLPNNLGLVLDRDGHVLVPIYIERETCAEQPVRCGTQDGQVVTARFVGSDRQTNLSVLQVSRTGANPLRFGAMRPTEGTIVLFLSPVDGSGRLGLWTGGSQDYGVVVTTDGQVAGIARYGQFLSGSACRIIGEQIIRFGAVKRATLGVIISEVRLDDALRRRVPALGSRTAMHVDEVVPGSAADRAGLKANDVLIALAGESVNDIPSLAAAIASRTGQTELQVLRGEQMLNITVDLQQQK